jgi:hypothetical protein
LAAVSADITTKRDQCKKSSRFEEHFAADETLMDSAGRLAARLGTAGGSGFDREVDQTERA